MRNHKRRDRWDPDKVSKDRDKLADALHNEHASGRETQEACLPFYVVFGLNVSDSWTT
jgi:hypothetical protein